MVCVCLRITKLEKTMKSYDKVTESYKPENAVLASYFTMAVVAILIVIKSYAYLMSGSTAMLGSLVDTIGDAAISFISFLSIKISLRPADHEHRFGHGKAEGFSAMLQGAFLVGAAVFLVFESVRAFVNPAQIHHHSLGISVSLIAIVLTVLIVFVQGLVLKRAPSLAVEADQGHYKSDVLLNISVVFALIADMFGGMGRVDVVIGFAIALYIGKTGYDVAKKATDMLMDREISPEERQKIIDIVKAHKDVYGLHDLRTRRSGMDLFICFDIELEPTLSLEAAHDITREIDLSLLEVFPNADIIIHKDPKGDTYDPRHKVQGVHH